MTDLPTFEFAFPGPLRDQLVAAVLSGAKTTTTGLLADYELENEALPEPGTRASVIDSAGEPVAVIEILEVRIAGVGEVDLEHAVNEGEGFTSVAEWRVAHEAYWHGADYREWRGDPGFTVADDTPAVLERFRVVEDQAE